MSFGSELGSTVTWINSTQEGVEGGLFNGRYLSKSWPYKTCSYANSGDGESSSNKSGLCSQQSDTISTARPSVSKPSKLWPRVLASVRFVPISQLVLFKCYKLCRKIKHFMMFAVRRIVRIKWTHYQNLLTLGTSCRSQISSRKVHKEFRLY